MGPAAPALPFGSALHALAGTSEQIHRLVREVLDEGVTVQLFPLSPLAVPLVLNVVVLGRIAALVILLVRGMNAGVGADASACMSLALSSSLFLLMDSLRASL